jgi:hypothetical protein
MDHQSDDDRIAGVARWLIAEARLSLAPLKLIDRFCHKLVCPDPALADPRMSFVGSCYGRPIDANEEHLRCDRESDF